MTTLDKKHKTVLKKLDRKTLNNVNLYRCTLYFHRNNLQSLPNKLVKNYFE